MANIYPHKLGTVTGMNSLKNDSLDKSGFESTGAHIQKHGTPSGEGAMFNYLPPGQDITNQKCAMFNPMPLKKITMMGYEGDGAFPVRDVPE